MHKFIPLNKNRNSHVVVTQYNWPIEEALKGNAIMVHVNCLDDIINIPKNLDETTKVSAFVYTNPYASLETIDVNPDWGDTPVVLRINRLGQFREVHLKVELLKRLNVMVIFTGPEEQATCDAQILSSLGIHSGVDLRPDAPLTDSVLDLITYAFYGQCPHASIEPFATIAKYYDGESYVSPEYAYFVNPERYVYTNKDQRMAFFPAELADEEKSFPAMNVRTEEFAEKAEAAADRWQEFFIESHPCTFCSAFRICLGYFQPKDCTREPGRCKEVMSELLEAIEFGKKANQSNKTERCQP